LALPGRRLFPEDVSLSKLLSLMSHGADIRTTRISEDYSFEQFLLEHPSRIVLLAFSDKGKIEAYQSRIPSVIAKGWTVVSLAVESEAVAGLQTEKAGPVE